ncbi:MAG: hypothetical protein ACREA3_07175 [Nitrosotalea sp.]
MGRTLAIILGGLGGGVIVIGVVMLAASGWETPGTYTGTSNGAHTVTDPNNCYAFQTGCKATGYGTSGDASTGSYLSSGSGLTSTYGANNAGASQSGSSNSYSP